MAHVGRKSKGDRHPFMTRIPRDAADQLIAEAERLGVSYSDLIALRVSEAYGVEMQLKPSPKDTNQGALEIAV